MNYIEKMFDEGMTREQIQKLLDTVADQKDKARQNELNEARNDVAAAVVKYFSALDICDKADEKECYDVIVELMKDCEKNFKDGPEEIKKIKSDDDILKRWIASL